MGICTKSCADRDDLGLLVGLPTVNVLRGVVRVGIREQRRPKPLAAWSLMAIIQYQCLVKVGIYSDL